MAKNRLVNTKFWDDNYIVELDPVEKLLFLYLITNPLTNIAGVYELKLRKVAFDTGIDKEIIQKILDKFIKDGKVLYFKDYIILKNAKRHQVLNDSVTQGIRNVLNEAPMKVIQHAVDTFRNNSKT